MSRNFKKILNRMSFFVFCLLAIIVMLFDFIARLCANNPVLNGIILGVFLFGIIVCFLQMFQLISEASWLERFLRNEDVSNSKLPPVIFRPIAKMLFMAKMEGRRFISPQTLNILTDMVDNRFENQRGHIRYITNVLILLGLLGTFWGLINVVQSFGDLIVSVSNSMGNTSDVFDILQMVLSGPLSGMGLAFSSSFLGLLSSLVVGFLYLQLVSAQVIVYNELENVLSDNTSVGFEVADNSSVVISNEIQNTLNNLIKSSVSLERTINSSKDFLNQNQIKSEDKVEMLVSSFNKNLSDVKSIFKQYLDLKPRLDKIMKMNDSGNKDIKKAILQLNSSVKKMNIAIISVGKTIKKKEGRHV